MCLLLRALQNTSHSSHQIFCRCYSGNEWKGGQRYERKGRILFRNEIYLCLMNGNVSIYGRQMHFT